jgi:hypothetical protein
MQGVVPQQCGKPSRRGTTAVVAERRVATGDLTRDRDGARDGMRATVAEAEGVRQWGLDASARDWFLWEATSKGSGAEMRWCRQEEGGAGLGAAAREEGEVGLGTVATEEGGEVLPSVGTGIGIR